MKNKKINVFLVSLVLTFLPFYSQAAGLIPCGDGRDMDDACTLCDFLVGFHNLVSFGSGLLITVAAVGIFIAGVMYILSSGNEEAMGKAKGFLGASLKGFAIVLGAWFIVSITMWILAAQSDLGIGKTSWSESNGVIEFNCD